MASLISINVGLPRDIEWRGELVHTAIWKAPVQGRVTARRLNLDGDGQGDLGGHGGEHRAVMVYQIDSYRYWAGHLGRNDLSFGQFGENFTVDGLPDAEVCIGDRYRIGSAVFEVTQPRVTCYRVGIRMDNPQMAALLVAHHRPGFYLRVIEEGEVAAGDEIARVASPSESVTVAQINDLLYMPGHPRDLLERALRVTALSSGWKNSLQALLDASSGTQAGNAGLAPSAPPPAWQGFRSLRVLQIERESQDIMSFTLGAVDGSPLPAALPGQFLVLKLQPGPQSPPLLRNYSLSSAPGAPAYRVSVKREPNGVASAFLHEAVRAGDVLQSSAPRGVSTLSSGRDPVVLLSAGIGATPVLAMLHALAATPQNRGREVWWLYGARNSSAHPFAKESEALLEQLPNSHKCVFYSYPSNDDQERYTTRGRISLAAIEELHVPKEATFYLCGPPLFLDGLTSGLKEWGVSPQRIRTEPFGPAASITPGIASTASKPPHAPAGPEGSGPQISFARSGLTVPWDSRYKSLLEYAEACDVPVRWSCRTGVCHTCECALIGGTCSYEPEPLDAPAVGNVLICCSRPLSDIQLDL